MRWLFVFMLMLNAIAYAWFVLKQDAGLTAAGSTIESAAVISFPDTARPLQLLSERPAVVLAPEQSVGEVVLAAGTEPVAEVEADVDFLPQPRPVTEPAMCAMLGPLPEVVIARQFMGRLASLDIGSSLKQDSQKIKPIYWVYLEPLGSRKAALVQLKQLQSKRIDSFLITRGDLKYGISLGYFRTEKSAAQVQGLRKKQGFDAQIVRKERSREVVWVALDGADSKKLSPQLFLTLKKDLEYLQKRQILCEHVASLADLE